MSGPQNLIFLELSDLRDELRQKDELISALDAQLITDEEELVSEVCEAEEIKKFNSTSITHISQIINTLSECAPISAPPDTSITQYPATTVRLSTIEPLPTSVGSPPISDIACKVIPPHPISTSHGFTRLPKLNTPTFAEDMLQWQSLGLF